jgi:outer membrane protein assembly factor BamB
MVLLGALLGSTLLMSQATGWNNGGGDPARTGHVPVIGPTENVLLWQVNAAGAFGSPVYIEGDRFVTMRFLGLAFSPVECRSLNTGELLWSREVTGGMGRSLPIGFRDGQVYVMRLTESLEDSLFALNAQTGDRIWASPATISNHITCSANFAPNGDLFVEGWSWPQTQGYMRRISRIDGSQLWECAFQPVSIGASEITVRGNTGYFVERIDGVTIITALDLTTGERLYSHPVNDTQPGGGGENYCALVIDQAGTIFYQKLGDNVSAFTDDGTQLSLLWETSIQGYAPFSQMCLGDDGTLYAPSNGQVIRLDPLTGAILNTSPVLAQNPQLFQMRASSPANDVIYVTDGEEQVHVFTPELELLWSDAVPNLNTSGVSIAPNGLVVVTGAGLIKAYKPTQITTDLQETGIITHSVHPNPARDRLVITPDPADIGAPFALHDACGREVLRGRLWHAPSTSIDLSGIPSGAYFLRLGRHAERVIIE